MGEVLWGEELLELLVLMLLLLLLEKKLLLLLWQERRPERKKQTHGHVLSPDDNSNTQAVQTQTDGSNKSCLHVNVFKQIYRYSSSGFKVTLRTYGLALLGSWKLCASAWGLSGGGWGLRAGSWGWLAFCKGDWITPFRLPSTPFIASWGLPARDAMSPPTRGREEPPAWLMAPKPSLRPRPRPFSRGWLKEAGLCWGGGVLWKERDELLRDGLPEWSSCNKDRKSAFQLSECQLAFDVYWVLLLPLDILYSHYMFDDTLSYHCDLSWAGHCNKV